MLLIGISGGTGCGKTTMVEQLIAQLDEEVILISQDDYYHDLSHLTYDERVAINFDHPDSIDFALLCKQLEALKEGVSIDKPVYSFVAHNRSTTTVRLSPKRIVIVEGILIFTQAELRDLLDHKIYVEADSDIRLVRRLKRDIIERGRDIEEVTDRYLNTLKPMHEQFIAPSKAYADLVVTNNEQGPLDITSVLELIASHAS